MPNSIKYNTSAETLALKSGNFWIGTGDVGKGPTNITGYYNGITPPSGGYTIYLNKESGGPSIYVATNDSQLISLTNRIAGASYTTVAQCLQYYVGQSDKVCVNIDYPNIVTNGMLLNFDVGFTPSYPTTGTTLYDVSSGGNNGTLVNSPTFNSGDGGSLVFDGVDDYVSASFTNLGFDVPWTIGCWFNTSASQITNVGLFNLSYFPELMMATDGKVFVWNSIGPNPADVVGYPTVMSTSSYNNGQWHYAVGSYNTGGLVKLYINGTLINSASYSPNGVRAIYNGVYMGVEFNNGPKNFNGKIASGIVYNRELSATEVLQNYNAQKGRYGL
jgi:hypothetical protein